MYPSLNVTSSPAGQGYLNVLDQVSITHPDLNTLECSWTAWYAFMQNDVYATGIMSFVLHEVVYFGRCLPFIIMDKIPLFNKYKIQAHKMPTWSGMKYHAPFPPIWKMFIQICICFVMEDTWHYWSHRALHYGPLYKSIHKMHHTYSAPFGLAAEYASPIETAILGFGVVGSPIVLLMITGDFHLFTMYIWIILRLFQAIDAHSGYDFPWSLRNFVPFWAGADHHDLHHEKFIRNYASSFRWWDYFLGTEARSAAARRRREALISKTRASKQE
ncbi:hypothetical protein FOBRF1_013651 [Fusarium oxysporum]